MYMYFEVSLASLLNYLHVVCSWFSFAIHLYGFSSTSWLSQPQALAFQVNAMNHLKCIVYVLYMYYSAGNCGNPATTTRGSTSTTTTTTTTVICSGTGMCTQYFRSTVTQNSNLRFSSRQVSCYVVVCHVLLTFTTKLCLPPPLLYLFQWFPSHTQCNYLPT